MTGQVSPQTKYSKGTILLMIFSGHKVSCSVNVIIEVSMEHKVLCRHVLNDFSSVTCKLLPKSVL